MKRRASLSKNRKSTVIIMLRSEPHKLDFAKDKSPIAETEERD